VGLGDLFEGRHQLIVYRFFYEPGVEGWPEKGCDSCSLVGSTSATPSASSSIQDRAGASQPSGERAGEAARSNRREGRRGMNRQEIDRELGQAGAGELLESAPLLHLAYNGPDGLPRVIPIGFHWDGEHIVICTATTAPKVRALSSRPEVALTIDVGTTPSEAKSVLVRGIATVEIVDGIPDEFLAASRKTLPAEQVEEFEHQVRSMYAQMARISIEPRWARFYDFGAGRMPWFLSKLASEANARARS
jgi:nitroimidazol reductase NimA-like FMN-containing flavoprotein (pyridoxamine 5'-phosphate oxidase superfamily)